MGAGAGGYAGPWTLELAAPPPPPPPLPLGPPWGPPSAGQRLWLLKWQPKRPACQQQSCSLACIPPDRPAAQLPVFAALPPVPRRRACCRH